MNLFLLLDVLGFSQRQLWNVPFGGLSDLVIVGRIILVDVN